MTVDAENSGQASTGGGAEKDVFQMPPSVSTGVLNLPSMLVWTCRAGRTEGSSHVGVAGWLLRGGQGNLYGWRLCCRRTARSPLPAPRHHIRQRLFWRTAACSFTGVRTFWACCRLMV